MSDEDAGSILALCCPIAARFEEVVDELVESAQLGDDIEHRIAAANMPGGEIGGLETLCPQSQFAGSGGTACFAQHRLQLFDGNQLLPEPLGQDGPDLAKACDPFQSQLAAGIFGAAFQNRAFSDA